MYAQRGSYAAERTTERAAWLVRPTEANSRAGRRLRRSAHRHTRLTLADHVAFWRAQHDGMRYTRGASALGWPGYAGLALLLALIAVGIAAGFVLL